MDKIVFNDYDVTVEIYDSVIAKWANTDYEETDPASAAYLRNRDKIQPKLVAGTNIIIDPLTNEISSELRLDQLAQLVSEDTGNELGLGSDGKLAVSFSGLLRNSGSVTTREELPETATQFQAFFIEDEDLYVFAHFDSELGLVWLPLSFYVDMSLYVSKKEQEKTLESYPTNDDLSTAITTHNNSEEAHPSILRSIESIRQEMSDKEHFRGYYATNAEVLAITKPESGDYAYSAESGTKWIYDTSWTDSKVVVPDQMVPPSDNLPLMDGEKASAGVSNQYARGDHIHPSDEAKLDKVESEAELVRVYAVGTDGDQSMVSVSLEADAATLPVRDANGEVAVATPTQDTSATPKKYTDDALAKKLDKQTTSAGTTSVYGVSGTTQKLVQAVDNASTAGSLALRKANGNLVVGTPTEENEATPKSYVDNSVRGASEARILETGFATFSDELLDNVVAKAVGNNQLLIQFTMKQDLTPDGSPLTVFSNAEQSIIPLLGLRFGQVWDYEKVEQVGFCVIDEGGDITINALATLFTGSRYTLLV